MICMLGNFSKKNCRLLIFFKINVFKYYQSVKQSGSRSGPTKCPPDKNVEPDLGPYYLHLDYQQTTLAGVNDWPT